LACRPRLRAFPVRASRRRRGQPDARRRHPQLTPAVAVHDASLVAAEPPPPHGGEPRYHAEADASLIRNGAARPGRAPPPAAPTLLRVRVVVRACRERPHFASTVFSGNPC
jgi:hypothetical protein